MTLTAYNESLIERFDIQYLAQTPAAREKWQKSGRLNLVAGRRWSIDMVGLLVAVRKIVTYLKETEALQVIRSCRYSFLWVMLTDIMTPYQLLVLQSYITLIYSCK